MFATVFAAVLEEDCDELCYLNCGHDAPVVIYDNGQMERLVPGSPAIGVFADLEFNCGRISLTKGESVVAFTDGVTDAQSIENKPFGEERLLDILSEAPMLENRLKNLQQAIKDHIVGADQYDDITFVGIERTD
jgi:sigma-B regulation protein RsbU (phosphoserine phosphatase)